jgi:DNA (cytosine-5)-methyltransferase 1
MTAAYAPARSLYDLADLFGGPGGWDSAAKELGLKAIGVELDPATCATRRAEGLATVEGDVRAYSPRDFPGVKHLIGSPPCQTFSVAGLGSGRRALDVVRDLARRMADGHDVRGDVAALEDERTGLVLEPLRWALEMLRWALEALDVDPYQTILLEQVPTVLPVWEVIAEILRELGYNVVTGKLSAEQFGAPQTRTRAVLMAKLGGPIALPEPTHRPFRKGIAQHDGDPRLKPWISMAEGLGWGMTHRPGMTVVAGTAAGGTDPSCVGGSGARATLRGELAAGRWIHRDEPGLADASVVDQTRVSVRDAALLQGFRSDYPFRGRKGEKFQQLANAVPRPLARAVLLAAELGATRDLGQAA